MVRLDETNVYILRLLQARGRAAVTEIAQAVGRSESTVRERMQSLEAAGIIQGYEARVDWRLAGLGCVAVVRARCPPDKVRKVAEDLRRCPNVIDCLLLTGPRPLMAVLRVRGLSHLREVMRDQLGAVALEDVEAELAMEILVPSRHPPIEADLAGPEALADAAAEPRAAAGEMPAPPPLPAPDPAAAAAAPGLARPARLRLADGQAVAAQFR